MERRRAIIASTALAGVVVFGAVGFAASSALGAGSSDNVGKLQPAAPTVTVVIDPATGTATAPAPTAATADRSASRARHDDDHEDDHEDHEEEDDDD